MLRAPMQPKTAGESELFKEDPEAEFKQQDRVRLRKFPADGHLKILMEDLMNSPEMEDKLLQDKQTAHHLDLFKVQMFKKICHQYDHYPVKIIREIYSDNFALLVNRYRQEIHKEVERKKNEKKPEFFRRVRNFFKKKKDPPGILQLNEELAGKIKDAVDEWKKSNRISLFSLYSPKKNVEQPYTARKSTVEEEWRKQLAQEQDITPSKDIATARRLSTFGDTNLEKEILKTANRMEEVPNLMKEAAEGSC